MANSVDFSKLSDEDIQKLASPSKAGSVPDFSKLSDEDIQKLASPKAAEKSQPITLEQPWYSMSGKGIKEAAIEQLPMIGTVVGGVAGTALGPVGSVGGAGLGAAAGKGLQNIIRGYQQDQMDASAPTLSGTVQAMKDQGQAGLEGAAAEGGGQVLGAGISKGVAKLAEGGLAKPFGKVGDYIGNKLKGVADDAGIRALGGTKGKLEKLDINGKLEGLGQAALDNNVVNSLDSAADVAKNAEALKDRTGAKIGDIYKDGEAAILEQHKLGNLAGAGDHQKDVDALLKGGFRPADDSKAFLDKMSVDLKGVPDGSKALSRVSEIVNDVAQNGDTVSLPKAIKIKGQIDRLVNYDTNIKDQPLVQEKLIEFRNLIQSRVEKQIGALSDSGLLTPDAASSLKDLNKLYGQASTMEQMAVKKAAGNRANNMVGLAEKTAGLAGLGHAAATGNIPEALAIAGVTIGSSVTRRFGAATAAKAASIVEKMVNGNPAAQALAKSNPKYITFLTDQVAAKLAGGSVIPSANAEEPDQNNPLQRRMEGQ